MKPTAPLPAKPTTADDTDPDTTEIARAAELAAKREAKHARKLEAAAAVKVANEAADLASEKLTEVRDVEWLATCGKRDTRMWEAISEAIAKLSPDATPQQIALAQAQAVFATKATLASEDAEHTQTLRHEATEATQDYEAKRDKAKQLQEDLETAHPWAAMGAGLLGAWISKL
jgi:hypothetical protein